MHINNTLNVDLNTYGFPQGYFVIKNVATNRFLDVDRDQVKDGTKIVLWPQKESSLVEGECTVQILPKQWPDLILDIVMCRYATT